MGITLDSIKNKMLGKKFGKLTILSYAGKSEYGDNIWKCKCECGTPVVNRTAAVSKPTSACPRCKRLSGPNAEKKRTQLLGQVFGKLSVLECAGLNKFDQITWLCQCECGNQIVVRTSALTCGESRSCGCGRSEAAKKQFSIHGLYEHPLYAIWSAMKERCYNPKHPSFHRYGDRGIRVCENWLGNFELFYNWALINGYQSGLTLERIDNDGNYDPGNCKWATYHEQAQNKSSNRINRDQVALIRTDTRVNSEIAKDYGVNESTISRIKARFTWSNVP